jgi:hypothetical protein
LQRPCQIGRSALLLFVHTQVGTAGILTRTEAPSPVHAMNTEHADCPARQDAVAGAWGPWAGFPADSGAAGMCPAAVSGRYQPASISINANLFADEFPLTGREAG